MNYCSHGIESPYREKNFQLIRNVLHGKLCLREFAAFFEGLQPSWLERDKILRQYYEVGGVVIPIWKRWKIGSKSIDRILRPRPSRGTPSIIWDLRLCAVYRWMILHITFGPVAICQLRYFSALSLDARPASRWVPSYYLKSLSDRPCRSSLSSVPLI